MKNNTKILFAIIAVIIVITGGVFMFVSFFGKFAGIEKENLESYQFQRSGDMLGSSYSKAVMRYNEDHALVTIIQKESHNDDGTAKEYLVNKEILDEIKTVFVKYRMKNWNNKRFTDTFVADGASYLYSFHFETNYVSFSSQYYPEKYSSKLEELHEIVGTYIENAALLPGLLSQDTVSETDDKLPFDLQSGKFDLSVYSYHQNYLCYRLVNGTDENREIESVIRLYRNGESVPIYEESYEHKTTFYAHNLNENRIILKERLVPDKYRLEAFGYTTEFEIR